MDKIIQALEQKIKQLEQHKSDYWRGVRDGYISSLDFIEQLNKPVVSGEPLVCPDCQTTNLHHMGHGAWCCAFCGGNSKPMACASGAVDKTVSDGEKLEEQKYYNAGYKPGMEQHEGWRAGSVRQVLLLEIWHYR